MNTISRYISWLGILACVSLSCTVLSCTDDPLPAGNEEKQEGLRFVIDSPASTRVSYEGNKSAFEDGELIGCVLGQKEGDSFHFIANTKWHYKADEGVLIYDSSTDETHTWITCDADGFITLVANSFEDASVEMNYGFFFYYPYVDGTILKEEIDKAVTAYKADKSTPFYRLLNYPNWATNADLNAPDPSNQWGTIGIEWGQSTFNNAYVFTGAPAINGTSTGDNSFHNYTWTEYPCFINHVQETKTQLNKSDFLWTCYTNNGNGITAAAATRPVRLTFEKKTATVDVVADTQLSDVRFVSTTGVLRGKEINLISGAFTDYNASTGDEYPMQTTRVRVTDPLYPCDLNSDGKWWRIHLAQQTNFICNLVFKMGDKEYTVQLEGEMENLDAGKRYVIHIDKRGYSHIEIHDWVNDHYEILDSSEASVSE